MQKIRVKICCISSVEEAILALSYGASALGLVGQMPSGPGITSDQQILEITTSLPPHGIDFFIDERNTTKSNY